MAVLTPKTVFLHIGRTGGHWVSHVLWRAGLVEARLAPLHIRPQQIATDPRSAARAFWFCFVRHPLTWFRSVWMHEIEYGWSEHSSELRSETFAEYLEKSLARFPSGPMSEQIVEFLEASHFVGRSENLAEDLATGLLRGGESIDFEHLRTPPLNNSSVSRVAASARAPRSLLEHVLAADTEFVRRFRYDYIPSSMIEDGLRPIAMLPEVRNRTRTTSADLADAVFDFPLRLSNGTAIEGHRGLKRSYWGLLTALESIEVHHRGRALVIPGGDGVIAHTAIALGYEAVAALVPERRVSFEVLNNITAKPIQTITSDLTELDASERYDTLVVADFLQRAREPMLTISQIARLVVAGGTLLLHTTILSVCSTVPLMFVFGSDEFHRRPDTTLLFNQVGFENLLKSVGFTDILIVDRFDEKPQMNAAGMIDRIGRVFGADPDHMIVNISLRASYRPDQLSGPGYSAAALETVWWKNRTLWMSDPAELEPAAPVRRENQALQHRVKTLEERIEQLTGALSDRERDLARERAELVELRARVYH